MSETQPEAPPNAPAVNLNITDIADIVKIVDYGFEQGAYKGLANIRQIISIRDRVDQFITQASSAIEQQQQAAEPEETEAEPSLLEDLLPPPRVNHKNHQA